MPSAFMLIHQFSSGMWGKHEEFKDEMALQAMLMSRLVQYYVRTTKISKEELEDKLKHDSWFNAEQCVENGLADAIL